MNCGDVLALLKKEHRHARFPQFDSSGRSRALLVWNRRIVPNGRLIVLERQPGADVAGCAGLSDRVNNHWGTDGSGVREGEAKRAN